MSTQQTEALQCAADLEYSISHHGMQDAFTLNAYRAMKMVRRQHARIADLEAQLEAIGAGGVSGPLIGQPQAMPDLSQLTERGAKAWAGVDAQGLREGFTAADMATVSAQGFRDGVASVDVAQERPTPEHIEAMQRAWLWMENQAEAQSKGGHATFDLMMLRDERDALRAAIDAARKQGEKQ